MATPDEQAIGRSWLGAAKAWTSDVRGRVMGPWRNGGSTPDASMVLSAEGMWVQQLQEKVRPSILGALRRSYASVTGRPAPGQFDQSQYVTEYLAAAINRMTGTPDQVYRQIADTIARGLDAGQGIGPIAADVQRILTVTGNDWWDNRAVVVARTEALGALNAGILAAGGAETARDGRPRVKTWQAHIDEATRAAHRAADGQTVSLYEPFIVDNEPLQFPGDPRGSAGNVIQCRCTLSVSATD